MGLLAAKFLPAAQHEKAFFYAGFGLRDKAIVRPVTIFVRSQRHAEMNVNASGPRESATARPRLERALDRGGDDDGLRPPSEGDKTAFKRLHIAVRGSCTLGENQQGIAGLQTTQAFLDAGQGIAFQIQWNGTIGPNKLREEPGAKKALPSQITDGPRYAGTDQGRIQVALVIRND